MVKRLIAPSGSLNINGKVALGLFLSGIVGQQLRAQADLAVVLRGQACGDDGRVVFLRRITSSMERFSMSMPLSAAAASVCE